MKKLLVLVLAVTLLVSTTGIAFAVDGNWFAKWKSGASVNGDIMKKIVFENEVGSETGDANSLGNGSMTMVCSKSEAKADNGGEALNDGEKTVTNDGTADVYSGDATATNQANNDVDYGLNEQTSATSDTKVVLDNIYLGCPDGVVSTSLGRDGGSITDAIDCCPASVDGDICTKVCIENEVCAESGDAYATGNESMTMVNSDSRALAFDGATAHNTDTISVTNDGAATAYSGEANASNVANNYVTIDIFRSATTVKNIDVLAEFLDD